MNGVLKILLSTFSQNSADDSRRPILLNQATYRINICYLLRLSPSPSSSPLPTSLTNNCPTCVAFNDGQCCQNDNGLSLFQEFRMANIHCYWDGKLSDAIASLRYKNNPISFHNQKSKFVTIINSHYIHSHQTFKLTDFKDMFVLEF